MANQYGGQRMGGIAPAAGAMTPQPFRNIVDGPVKSFLLTLLISLKSSAAAFSAVVDTNIAGSLQGAAEGVDDMDLLLNALISQTAMNWDESTPCFFGITPAQLRTVLGYMLKRDFAGTFGNGSSVPISSGSATQYQFQIEIPVALLNLFDDGEVFQQGSERLTKGELDLSWGTSITPAVVLANGTANVSGVSTNLFAVTGLGTPYDVGLAWQFRRVTGLATAGELGEGTRIGVLDVLPAATNGATQIRFGDTNLATPREYAMMFQGQTIPTGGFDPSYRCTPYLWVPPTMKFHDFQALLAKKSDYDAIGVGSIGFYDIRAVQPPPSVVERIGKSANAGGPVAIQHPSPRSVPTGTAISPALQGMLPVRPVAPSAARGAPTVASPAHAAANVIQKQASTARVATFAKSFIRK